MIEISLSFSHFPFLLHFSLSPFPANYDTYLDLPATSVFDLPPSLYLLPPTVPKTLLQ